jgi:uncharacterized protein (DUF302 family)
MQTDVSLGFEVRLDTSIERAQDRVTEALRAQGFGVLTKIDVRRTLADKLGVAFRDYLILGACNPRLAHRSLSARSEVGLLLPCNVTLEGTTDDGIVVRIADPRVMLEASGLGTDPELAAVAREAHDLLAATARSLAEKTPHE